jgi:hypothetical protein
LDHLQVQSNVLLLGQATFQLNQSQLPQRFVVGMLYVDAPLAVPQVAFTGQFHSSVQVLALYVQGIGPQVDTEVRL